MYEIKRGGHADMKRIYPMMEYDFKDWERPSLVECQMALLKGAELLLLKDENGFECGYALMLRDRAHRYALLGWLGVFLTGSDTSSCALFGGMQKDTALAVGMRPELAVASNASGGVTAKMISPQSLSVATAATNNAGQEGKLFRFTIGHSIGMTLVLCVLAYLQAGPLSWMLP